MKIFNVIIIDREIESSILLANMLSNYNNINIISIEKDSHVAFDKILKFRPDILFLAIEMPIFNGFEIIKKLKSQSFFPRIVLLSSQCQYGIKAIKEGVFDYIIKPIDNQEICDCIGRLESIDNVSFTELTYKEKEIMHCLCQGWPIKQIGVNLNLSPHTISYHRNKILKKTGTKSTAQLLSKAMS